MNTSKDNPIECTYLFPLEASTILANFSAKIGDRTINTKVIEKEKAKEKYDDAIAGGHTAVMAER